MSVEIIVAMPVWRLLSSSLEDELEESSLGKSGWMRRRDATFISRRCSLPSSLAWNLGYL